MLATSVASERAAATDQHRDRDRGIQDRIRGVPRGDHQFEQRQQPGADGSRARENAEGYFRPFYRAQSVAKYSVELPEKCLFSEARV